MGSLWAILELSCGHLRLQYTGHYYYRPLSSSSSLPRIRISCPYLISVSHPGTSHLGASHLGIFHRYLSSVSHVGISSRYLISVSHFGIPYPYLISVSRSASLTSVSHLGISHLSISHLGISHRYLSTVMVQSPVMGRSCRDSGFDYRPVVCKKPPSLISVSHIRISIRYLVSVSHIGVISVSHIGTALALDKRTNEAEYLS